MLSNNWLYVKNPYLDHLVFGSDYEEIVNFFEKITSWVNTSLVNEQESKFLLTKMVKELFDIKTEISFNYRLNVIEKIIRKPAYSLIEKTMKAEIMRIYRKTQAKLQSENDSQTLLLYRGLTSNELGNYYKNPSLLKTNTLVSFTTDKNRYQREVQVAVEVPIESVLFYRDLCPFNEQGYGMCRLGLHIEEEVIVINPNQHFKIKDVKINHRFRRLREAEEKYL
ncbi:hypothetical protein CHCC20333_3476 [Bacillus paralicheniformis]|uniref:hypothetical protein n=1 Tax=Bacillus paralicheniformis TaxID=1648923 RepID=UPI0011BE54B8|nr:hypothetical protein [Bacillus paralicheniformis]TWK86617.1 hypothetical protein CHCC20333_3476 [Bacillus paralicheniformis]